MKKRRQIDRTKEFYKRDSRPEIQFRKQLRRGNCGQEKEKKINNNFTFFSLSSSPLHFASLSRYKK